MTEPGTWPTADWQTAEPEQAGLKPEFAIELDRYARNTMPPIRGIVVVRRGRIAFEQYYAGCTRETLHCVNSVTKSVTSALIGILLRKGLLTSLDQSLIDLLPELGDVNSDPRAQAITLRHLLAQTSGFEGPGAFPGDRLMGADLINTVWGRLFVAEPGTSFVYDDLSVHSLSILITRLTSESAAAFAARELFGPLGIWASQDVRFAWTRDRGLNDTFHFRGLWPDDGYPWRVDQHGHSLGGFGLSLTVREMAKFGYLYLNEGRWDGAEIVPAWFARESTREQSPGGPPAHARYGYLWWIGRAHGYFASGFGGQLIHVIPEHDTIIALTTTLPNPPGPIFQRFVEPAIVE
jgi:CubicO group peptidase (beta-lactamase class C family)